MGVVDGVIVEDEVVDDDEDDGGGGGGGGWWVDNDVCEMETSCCNADDEVDEDKEDGLALGAEGTDGWTEDGVDKDERDCGGEMLVEEEEWEVTAAVLDDDDRVGKSCECEEL